MGRCLTYIPCLKKLSEGSACWCIEHLTFKLNPNLTDMATKLLNPSYIGSFNQRFREKRFLFFTDLLDRINSKAPIHILDIGGTEIYWDRMGFTNRDNVHITLLNLTPTSVSNVRFSSVVGDACNLSEYGDKEFDVVYSNSVIEHLFTAENQEKMAKEVRRVGKNYYIQTPNYYFPIEPHWLFPFFQFLPYGLRVKMTENYSLGNFPKTRDKDAAKIRVDEINLLTARQMERLFPEGNMYKEIFMGLTKSITMYHFPNVKKA